MRFAGSFFLTLFVAASCICQSSALLFKKPTVSLSFGAGIFHLPKGNTTFWNAGPGGSTRFMITVSKPVSIGIGVDAAVFSFDEQAFRIAYPTVPVRSKNTMMANVYLAMKCMVMPSMRLSPYIGLTLGATRLSEAIYGEVIDGVRVDYYNIPARTRPTFGLSLGAGIYIAQWISFDTEAKANYVLNNPDLKAAFLFLGGFRFTF